MQKKSVERVFSWGLSKTEPLFELQPTCTSGMQCLLLPWKSEKVSESFFFFWVCACVCTVSLRVSLHSAGYTVHNIDVRLYKVANQISRRGVAAVAPCGVCFPAPVITHCPVLPPVAPLWNKLKQISLQLSEATAVWILWGFFSVNTEGFLFGLQ